MLVGGSVTAAMVVALIDSNVQRGIEEEGVLGYEWHNEMLPSKYKEYNNINIIYIYIL